MLVLLKKSLMNSDNDKLSNALRSLFTHFRFCGSESIFICYIIVTKCRYCKFVNHIVNLHKDHCNGCLLCKEDSGFIIFLMNRQNRITE